MEEYEDVCRFIVTCNNTFKVSKAVQDRCKVFNFDYSPEQRSQMTPQILKRMVKILKDEKVEYDESAIGKVIDAKFPSIRGMIQMISTYVDCTGMLDDGVVSVAGHNNDIIDLVIAGKLSKLRRYMLDVSGDYDGIYTFLFQNLPKKLPSGSKFKIIPVLSEFMWRQSQGVIDPDINFSHCIYQIISVLQQGRK